MRSNRSLLEALVSEDPLPYLENDAAVIRRLAVVACRSLGKAALEPLATVLGTDEDEHVRAEAVEILAALGIDAFSTVEAAAGDGSALVVEAVAHAFGEIAHRDAVPWLIETATGDAGGPVREAALAALGAIGDDRGLPVLLELARTGRPQLRRRAIVALTAFEGAEVEAAFVAARLDRNPMVREAAEMVIGRSAG